LSFSSIFLLGTFNTVQPVEGAQPWRATKSFKGHVIPMRSSGLEH